MLKNRNISNFLKFKFSSLHLLEHFFTLPKSKLTMQELQLSVAKELKHLGKSKTIQIERVSGLTDKELQDKYFKKHIPVIIEDRASGFKCMNKWTPEFLKENYGDTIIPLVSPDVKTLERLEHTETTLKEIIECFESGDTTKYARFNDLFYQYPELMDDYDKKWFQKMKLKTGVGDLFNIFIGAGGTKTALHSACSVNLFTQVYGEKKWTIIPPEYDSIVNPLVTRTQFFVTELDPENVNEKINPSYDYLQKYECILKPGDMLYMPSCWWHQVTNLSASIGFAYRWFDPIDTFTGSIVQSLCFLASTNPPLWDYATKGKKFSKEILREVKK